MDNKQQTGKWERKYSRPNVYADLNWHCSNCFGVVSEQYAGYWYKYCPCCGAKMEAADPDQL